MERRPFSLLLLLAPLLALGCSGPPPITGCEARDGFEPVCGFQNPEDLAVLPGGEWLLVSQGATPRAPGSLVAHRLADGHREMLWPGGGLAGDAEVSGCPGPPDAAAFAPHGIDLRADGALVYVVNHGGREAVEHFALDAAGGVPRLRWSGCTPVPEALDATLNDVAQVPRGFVATKMMSAGALGAVPLLFGWESGQLLRWTGAAGWEAVPGSGGAGPNGVEATADGTRYFFAEWVAERVVRVNADGSGRAETAALGFSPDNLTWAPDGSLLAAGQVASALEATGCFDVPEGTCGLGSRVARIDPDTLAFTLVVDHAPATVAGGVSVAVEHGGRIWLGTFGGDRIAWTNAP